jgi:hypothetical protein
VSRGVRCRTGLSMGEWLLVQVKWVWVWVGLVAAETTMGLIWVWVLHGPRHPQAAVCSLCTRFEGAFSAAVTCAYTCSCAAAITRHLIASLCAEGASYTCFKGSHPLGESLSVRVGARQTTAYALRMHTVTHRDELHYWRDAIYYCVK